MDIYKKRMSIVDELEIWCIQRAYQNSDHKVDSRTLRWELFVFVSLVIATCWWSNNRLSNLTDSLRFHGEDFYGDKISDGDKFDYIVVGAGAAGSAAAARLAEAGLNVLLVEAGGDPNIITKIPRASSVSIGTNIDWAYDTLPNNKSCLAGKDSKCIFSRGKCLGGSTTINKLMYSRGNRKDFDFDLPGWSWEDMEPYFLRFEKFKDIQNLPESSRRYHNSTGIMPIEQFEDTYIPWHSKLFQGFQFLNFPKNIDVNGVSQIGVTRIPGYVSGGQRVTTADVYLKTNFENRLTVAKNVLCTGVILDDNNVAIGIKVFKNNETLHLLSKHEVILSAGAIGTPHILMLSGIGPKDQLQNLHISVKSDLPVGENMSDHILPITVIKVDHNDRRASDILTIAKRAYDSVKWLTTRSGEFASIGIEDVTTFVNSKCYDFNDKKLNNNHPECEIPSLQYIISYMDKGIVNFMLPIFDRIISRKDHIRDQLANANDNSAFVFMAPVVLRPHSRGWIRLASADPMVPPLIMPNYLEDDRDVEEMVRGLKIVEDLVNTPVFQSQNASILRLKFEECEGESDEYWRCYARQMTYSVHHAVGTASLGPVLDAHMRVHGIKNLRVSDASALPQIPRGNTAAAMIALGERISDMVLQDIGMDTYISKYKTYH